MNTAASSTHAPVQPESDYRELVSRLSESSVYRDYESSFRAITGLPLVLRATASFQATTTQSKQTNSLCALMAARNKTCAACLQLRARLETAAQEKSGTLECFAGLNETAVPIRLGEKVIAYLLTGQVLFRAPTDEETANVSKRIHGMDNGVSESGAADCYRRSRVVEKSQYDAIIRLLEIFSQHLSALSNQMMVKTTHAEVPSIARARAYIADHQDESLSLQDVARSVGMSAFYFCKTFKKSTGLTFTDYLSRVRVETVKQLLLDPHKRISEAAFEAGFQSLSQFNRVFDRVTGESPTHFRDGLNKSSRGRFSPQAMVMAA